MDLTNLTQEQINKLKEIAAKVGVSLNELLEGKDVNSLLESYKDQNFGILNEYDKENHYTF